jgi:hypothetical protein
MEELRKKLIFASCYFAILLLGCHCSTLPTKRNDIYTRCAKGDTISFELFKKMGCIEKTDKWFFIWLNLREYGIPIYAPHLLVCDHNLVLKGATGIVPGISEVKGDTLFGFASEEYEKEKAETIKIFRDDLPKEIVLKLEKSKDSTWNGWQRRAEAIVDSIHFCADSFNVKIFLRVSDGTVFPSRKLYFKDIEYSKKFCHTKIIDLPISSLHFSYLDEYVYTYIIEGKDVMYEMHPLEDKILDKLFLDIWQTIKPK